MPPKKANKASSEAAAADAASPAKSQSSPAKPAGGGLSAGQPWEVATQAELQKAAAKAHRDVTVKLFTGQWRLVKSRSEPLNAILQKQDVNLIVRQVTDRVVPVLTTNVTDKAVETHIKTSVSKQDVTTKFDGTKTEWFSSGRGDLVTEACLQDGGRTLYMKTFVPPEQKVAVEHKWIRVVDVASGGIEMVEHYRFDPNGAEDDQSLRCTRYFEQHARDE